MIGPFRGLPLVCQWPSGCLGTPTLVSTEPEMYLCEEHVRFMLETVPESGWASSFRPIPEGTKDQRRGHDWVG